MDLYNEIVKQIDLEGNKYEVAIVREFEAIEFTIDVEASKSTPYNLNENALKFANKFLITEVFTQAETNALAGFLLKTNGCMIPCRSYFLDATNKLETQPLGVYTKGFWCTTANRRYPNLNFKIEKDALLRFYVYNTHTSPQELYITILGYRIFERVLKPIK